MNSVDQISIWVSFQLSAIFFVGLPVTLFIWAIKKRNKAIKKLLISYWKISILFFISLILLIGKLSFGLLITNLAILLMTISVWFWNDINNELKEYKIWHPLSTVTKIWRWALTFTSINFIIRSFNNQRCLLNINSEDCLNWLEPSKKLYSLFKNLFNFLFGANFSEPIALFLGLFALLIYTLGLLQWFLIKLPKNGRNASFSNDDEF